LRGGGDINGGIAPSPSPRGVCTITPQGKPSPLPTVPFGQAGVKGEEEKVDAGVYFSAF